MAEPEVTVVCAWCGSNLRDGAGGAVSHGICPECSAAFLAGAGHPRERRLTAIRACIGRLARCVGARSAAARRLAAHLIAFITIGRPPARQS